MRVVSRTVWFASAVAACSRSALGRRSQPHAQAAHSILTRRKLKNPVAASPASIAAGKKLYDAQCASCHGTTGKGDGKAARIAEADAVRPDRRRLEARPTDGEIFTVIRDGAKGRRGMRGLRQPGCRRNDIWNRRELRAQHSAQRPPSRTNSMKIVVADDLPDSALELLRAEPGWQIDARSGRPAADLAAALADADALLVRSATKVTADLLAAAPQAAHRRPRRHRRRQHRRGRRQRARHPRRQRAGREQHQRRRARLRADAGARPQRCPPPIGR